MNVPSVNVRGKNREALLSGLLKKSNRVFVLRVKAMRRFTIERPMNRYRAPVIQALVNNNNWSSQEYSAPGGPGAFLLQLIYFKRRLDLYIEKAGRTQVFVLASETLTRNEFDFDGVSGLN